jgi:hypothetical protein
MFEELTIHSKKTSTICHEKIRQSDNFMRLVPKILQSMNITKATFMGKTMRKNIFVVLIKGSIIVD